MQLKINASSIVGIMRTPFLIAFALLAATGLDARSQTATLDRSLMFDPNALPGAPKSTQVPAQAPTQSPAKAQSTREAKKPAWPAQPPQRNVAPARDGQPPIARETPQIEPHQLGRIPFETGTIGLTTDRKYSNSTFNDGRVTPGFENVQTKSPSYFGFSLSVPTDKQRLIPLPGFSRQD